MNRRGFFWLLAAVFATAFFGKSAFRAGFKIPRPTRLDGVEIPYRDIAREMGEQGFLSVEPETPKPNQTTFTRAWTDGHDNAGETMQHVTNNPRWTDVEKVTNEPLGSGSYWRHTVRWVETHR